MHTCINTLCVDNLNDIISTAHCFSIVLLMNIKLIKGYTLITFYCFLLRECLAKQKKFKGMDILFQSIRTMHRMINGMLLILVRSLIL